MTELGILMTTVLMTTERGTRCPIRDKDGHRCNQKIGHEALHSAFGLRFKAPMILAKAVPK